MRTSTSCRSVFAAFATIALVATASCSGTDEKASTTTPSTTAPSTDATPPESGAITIVQGVQGEAIDQLVQDLVDANGLNAAIVRVAIGGNTVITKAYGQSMTGVPATTDMHFRNGAVAISYVSTLLLSYVDQGKANLDDPLSTWLPDQPDADQVTLRMLSDMTAGYPDYVPNPGFVAAFEADPFRQFTSDEQLAYSAEQPRLFAPGTNWDYSHTDVVLLGLALEAIGGAPLDQLLEKEVLDPLGLDNTTDPGTPAIEEPALHAFTAERKATLGIPSDTPFLEESSYWNPSWTLAHGAIQTTDIFDMAATATAVGKGTLLSPESHAAQVDPRLIGFGSPLEGCRNCHELDTTYSYGLGVVLKGGWILQNPLFGGYGAVEAYLPSQDIAVAVAVTLTEEAFDDNGNLLLPNAGSTLFHEIAMLLAPDETPPST